MPALAYGYAPSGTPFVPFLMFPSTSTNRTPERLSLARAVTVTWPSSAVRSSDAIRTAATELGIAVRAGVHCGEMEIAGPNVVGMTVHIGACVAALAGADEILASRTVRDLVAGSGLAFADRGTHRLKGVPDEWQLFALVAAGEQTDQLPDEPSMQTPTDKLVLSMIRRTPWLTRTAARAGNHVQRRRAGRVRE